jgi:O-antigen biosynthesis protein
MEKYPLVSIIIPAYKPMWFKECIESALAQTYPHCEIIVGDDSPDGHIESLAAEYLNDGRFPVSYIRTGRSNGSIHNYETSLPFAKGKYVKFLNDDDLIAPDNIACQVTVMEQNPSLSLTTSRRHLIDPLGKILPQAFASGEAVKHDSIMKGEDVIRWQSIHLKNFIGEPCCVLFRNELLQALMASEGSLFKIEGKTINFVDDLTLYLKMLRLGDLAYLTEKTASFRLSGLQISQIARENDHSASENATYLCEFLKKSGWFTERHLNGDFVQVASLLEPNEYQFVNIHSNLHNSLTESILKNWVKIRKISVTERQLIDTHHNENNINPSISICVRHVEGSVDLINKTVDSIDAALLQGVHFTLTIFSDQHFDSEHEIVVFADEVEYIHALNAHVDRSECEWLVCVDSGTEFTESGQKSLQFNLPKHREELALYADELNYVGEYVTGASFRPELNLDLLLSNPDEQSRNWFFRRELIMAVGGFDATSGIGAEFGLILKLIESNHAHTIGHIAEPMFISKEYLQRMHRIEPLLLQHLTNRGYNDAVAMRYEDRYFNIHYQHAEKPLVSIVIISELEPIAMMKALASIVENTRYEQYQLIVSTNYPLSETQKNQLHQISILVNKEIKWSEGNGSANYASLCNQAILLSDGDFCVFIADDLSIAKPEWLNDLLNHGQRPEVGIVGGKQIDQQGIVLHAGYILGSQDIAMHAFAGKHESHLTHMARLRLTQNYSAVSGKFMLVKKSLLIEINGFDSSLTSYADIDLCLRARETGHLIVWTPFAQAVDQRSDAERKAQIKILENDRKIIFERWMPILSHDPAYNVNLSVSSDSFDIALDSQRSWQPLYWKPLPVVIPAAADLSGCGFYRIIEPFSAMQEAGLVGGQMLPGWQGVPVLNQYQADSLILQRQFSENFHEWVSDVKKYTNLYKVFELDDYLPNVPVKNVHRENFKGDTLKMLRKSFSFVDRFVVSTAELGNAFEGMHPNIVVVNNRLPERWWGNLKSLRNQGRKPRVGWAGGSSHTGDLEMIFDVVKAFADEVEWVFLGMCPAKMKPYLHEFHMGTDINLYPEKLASLNLDLALAPVEENIFNNCKSNLRLLEYGACGYPVIASDVACYRGDLPVTLVRNRFKDWSDALRMHLDDRKASEKMGDELRLAVMKNWMLTGANVSEWAKAWLPD